VFICLFYVDFFQNLYSILCKPRKGQRFYLCLFVFICFLLVCLLVKIYIRYCADQEKGTVFVYVYLFVYLFCCLFCLFSLFFSSSFLNSFVCYSKIATKEQKIHRFPSKSESKKRTQTTRTHTQQTNTNRVTEEHVFFLLIRF
jgi:hypothetical protein